VLQLDATVCILSNTVTCNILRKEILTIFHICKKDNTPIITLFNSVAKGIYDRWTARRFVYDRLPGDELWENRGWSADAFLFITIRLIDVSSFLIIDAFYANLT
jgi:hypothetical protein